MKQAIVIDANEIKAMLAERFKVPEKNIIKSQYSYTVVLEEENEHRNETKNDTDNSDLA